MHPIERSRGAPERLTRGLTERSTGVPGERSMGLLIEGLYWYWCPVSTSEHHDPQYHEVPKFQLLEKVHCSGDVSWDAHPGVLNLGDAVLCNMLFRSIRGEIWVYTFVLLWSAFAPACSGLGALSRVDDVRAWMGFPEGPDSIRLFPA